MLQEINLLAKNIKHKYYIYELLDPRDGSCRYIGKSKNPEKRLKQHLSPYQLKKNTPKNAWIKKLKTMGLSPIMRIIAISCETYINNSEIYLIEKYKKNGHNLTNSTIGGDGISFMSEQIKNKISQSKKGRGIGRKVSIETRKKISESQKGKNRKKWTESKYKKMCKPIIGINKETQEIFYFNSIAEASRKFNLDSGHISKCCKNKSKSHGGFFWRYN